MTQEKKKALIGTIILIVFVGIPLGFVLSPIFTIIFSAIMLLQLAKKK